MSFFSFFRSLDLNFLNIALHDWSLFSLWSTFILCYTYTTSATFTALSVFLPVILSCWLASSIKDRSGCPMPNGMDHKQQPFWLDDHSCCRSAIIGPVCNAGCWLAKHTQGRALLLAQSAMRAADWLSTLNETIIGPVFNAGCWLVELTQCRAISLAHASMRAADRLSTLYAERYHWPRLQRGMLIGWTHSMRDADWLSTL